MKQEAKALSEYEYTKLSLNKEFLDKIQQFIEEYPEKGYRNLTHFVEDAVRHRADELKVFELIPRARSTMRETRYLSIF